MILYIGIFCMQGAEYAGRERFSSTRFGITFLFIFAFLMLQFYSASIVGSLLMAPPKFIRTIPDLTASSLDVGMQNIVYNYDFFTVSGWKGYLYFHLFDHLLKHPPAHQRCRCFGVIRQEDTSPGQIHWQHLSELLLN